MSQGTTIVNMVIMARISDWLFEHVVIAPEHATHVDLRWLGDILAGRQRPNIMMIVDKLCTLPGWGVCDLTHSVSADRIYWHLMLSGPRCERADNPFVVTNADSPAKIAEQIL